MNQLCDETYLQLHRQQHDVKEEVCKEKEKTNAEIVKICQYLKVTHEDLHTYYSNIIKSSNEIVAECYNLKIRFSDRTKECADLVGEHNKLLDEHNKLVEECKERRILTKYK